LLSFYVLSLFACSTDTARELEIVQTASREAGAFAAVVCNHWAQGGAGAMQLAEAVVAASKTESHFRFLYELEVS
jgi:methylenetetrahydrofolate dehydrogenase (NADP+)/methenyltetrahydrofolate cyclohydrolase/formyltetrahydrofolate synthetase